MAVHESPATAGAKHPAKGRVLMGISHGGQSEPADGSLDASTPFNYLFADLAAAWPAAHLPTDDPAAVVEALKTLGHAMLEEDPAPGEELTQPGNSVIPPIYTYWGQFVDHDTTRNTDVATDTSDITKEPFVPRDPADVVETLVNKRHPALNLDSLYGDGPQFDPDVPTDAARFYDGVKFIVGDIALVADAPPPPIPGVHVHVEGDLAHDLPRVAVTTADERVSQAIIGDGRNDENLIVAQLHVAFLRFHNAVVDWVIANEPQCTGDVAIFERAQQLVQFHYQWLTLNDFLPTLTTTGTADQVLFSENHLFEPDPENPFMPLEYSVAAFRFGHTMVRGFYDYNRNFGNPGTFFIRNASFENLFRFTGKAPIPFRGGTKVLPFNWVIEWDRFIDKGSPEPSHFARKLDTNLAPPLDILFNEGEVPEGEDPLPVPIKTILKALAVRNLLRGYQLGIPTGQNVAEILGIEPLSEEELKRDNSQALNDALVDGDFIIDTPLWFYVLKEAEVRANGNGLGPVGSRIVCETIVGQLRVDPCSFLNADGGWTPANGVKFEDGTPLTSIGDLIKFAGVEKGRPLQEQPAPAPGP